ncbi:MAG: SufS family cysteine desulfurase [Candidatus Diapherotrites archaeon]|nr:SufS family cysteine desulfurase [Candidatus Diapherotrites archaeon]
MDVERIRRDFPILSLKVNARPLVYLDNAATTQKPLQVLNAMQGYYTLSNANVHRGIHYLSARATELYEDAHIRAAQFFGAKSMQEMVFTKNATEALNLAAYSLTQSLRPGDEIVLTFMEHHSNIVPWQQLALQRGLKVRFVPIQSNGQLDVHVLDEMLSERTKIVGVVHASNVLGTINDVKSIARRAHKAGAKVVVDGAQSAPHVKVDVRELDCDFFAFSGHKMLGPTGIGGLYGKQELLERLPPFLFGGDMIREVHATHSKWNDLPWKFEAGTPPIAEAVGLHAAMDYLNALDLDRVHAHEQMLVFRALNGLAKMPGVHVLGPLDARARTGLVSFETPSVHPHDLAEVLNAQGIGIRGGHHCAMPLAEHLNLKNGSARASFYVYNSLSEVDALLAGVKKALKLFG